MPLARAADAVEAMLKLSAARGVSHARLTLSPAELGGVEVRLRHTAGGLSATIVADTPQAAQALQQAADGLRRGLEAQGVTLLSLDVGTRSDDAAFAAGQEPGKQGFGDQRPQGERWRGGRPALGIGDDHDPDDERELAVHPGALVDVRA